MIIKKGTKYYRVEKEMTQKEVDEYKSNLQNHYDTLGERTNNKIKEMQDKFAIDKEKAQKELDELNAIE